MSDRSWYLATISVGIVACAPKNFEAGRYLESMDTTIALASIAGLVACLVLQRRQRARQVSDLRQLWHNATERAAHMEERFDLTASALQYARARCRELEREVAQCDAVAAGLRLQLQPDIAPTYYEAAEARGYDAVNREMRLAALGADGMPWARRAGN